MDDAVKSIIQCETFDVTTVFLALGGVCTVCGKEVPHGSAVAIYCIHFYKHVVCNHCAGVIITDRETMIFRTVEMVDATENMKSIMDKFKSRIKGGSY